MTEEEDFLARWSRRKRAAAAGEPEKESENEPSELKSEPAKEQSGHAEPAAGPDTPRESGEPLDLSKLPPLDSIGPATDMRAFLQAGVPETLKRAALRRAWAADPAVRDFVGLSENSWDFTAPDALPGFGALDPAEVPRLLANLLGAPSQPDGGAPNEATAASSPAESPPAAAQDGTPPQTGDAGAEDAALQPGDDAASQNHPDDDARAVSARRRSHGRALPR